MALMWFDFVEVVVAFLRLDFVEVVGVSRCIMLMQDRNFFPF